MNTNEKLRSALEEADICLSGCGIDEEMPVRKMIAAALALPRLNCEVGTAEEQFKRHSKWCATTRDFSCANSMCRKCFADWAQMPYESDVKNG